MGAPTLQEWRTFPTVVGVMVNEASCVVEKKGTPGGFVRARMINPPMIKPASLAMMRATRAGDSSAWWPRVSITTPISTLSATGSMNEPSTDCVDQKQTLL